MNFIIYRTSNHVDKPCEEAILKKHMLENQGDSSEGWTVEINSIEDLVDFTDKYGNIIIKGRDSFHPVSSIEIYDDFRES